MSQIVSIKWKAILSVLLKLSGEIIFKLPDSQKMWHLAAEQPGVIWH